MGNARASESGMSNQVQTLTLFLYKPISPNPVSLQGNDRTIMKQNKKEELQSRREFFKKAAKCALPILGAIALANMPMVARASESEMGCRYGCSGSCSGGCSSSCSGSCRYTCSGTCKNTCEGCRHTCSGSCSHSCSGTCKHSSSR